MRDMLGLCSQRGIPHSNAEYAQQPVPAEQAPRSPTLCLLTSQTTVVT